MAGRARDLARIEELLALPMLLREERNELYEAAHRRMVDVRQKRLEQLIRQRWLMEDDVNELGQLCRELDVTVETKRHVLEGDAAWR